MDEDAGQLIGTLRRHVADERVLEAIAAVPRERFVPDGAQAHAWENRALGIACGQTISQPLVVARMAELLELRATDRVLDVGTGSGYAAAILARLAAHVWSIERHAELSEGAARALAGIRAANVTLVLGDGTRGLPSQAPFDAIHVAATGSLDALTDLDEQLGPDGRLVAPVSEAEQRLIVVRRTPSGLERRLFEEVRFVPLVRDREPS